MYVETSHAAQDYLKVIYEMTIDGQRASTNQIAEQMRVTPASATGMIQRLAAEEPPLVDYQKHHGVSLTVEGERTALEIIRHHRLLEAFLQKKLGYSWDKVHAEADRLEHVISEELEERISLSLGNPSYDPHGGPIPNRELEMPNQSNLRLSDLHPGSHVTIQRINHATPGMLRYLSSIGIMPDISITVLEESPFDGNLRVKLDSQSVVLVLGIPITSRIFVTPE